MIDWAYALTGAIVGFVVGLSGVGGGALMTPLLVIMFNVPPTTAIATDLWFAAITKLVGARMHHTRGHVDWQVAKRFWLGSIPMTMIVTIGVSAGVLVPKIDWLNKAIGVVVLMTALGMLAAPHLLGYARFLRVGWPKRFKAMQSGLTITSGGILGLCVALTSVGAGALGSVMMLYLYPLRMTPIRVVATDIAHAIPLAIIAGIGYLPTGWVELEMLGSLLVGSIPAVIVGSILADKVNKRSIQIFLAFVLIIASLKMLGCI